MSNDFPDGMTPRQVWQYIFSTLSKYSQGVLAFCAILLVPLAIVMSVYLVHYASDVRRLADQTQSQFAVQLLEGFQRLLSQRNASMPDFSLTPKDRREAPAIFEYRPLVSDQPKTEISRWEQAFGPQTWSNWAVVLIALLAAGIANKTLSAIKRQADLIQDQTKASKARERARLEVLFPPDPLDLNAHWEIIRDGVPFEPTISVVNHGYTKAFNVRAAGLLNIVQSEKTVLSYDGCNLDIPRVIQVGEEAEKVLLSPMGSFFVIEQRLIDEVQERRLFLRMAGEVTYLDVYGDSHHTPFTFLWRVEEFQYTEDESRDESHWINESPDAT